MEYYNYIKSIHLVFVITWFAGLFYIPRLFIYQIESAAKKDPEKSILINQLKLMAYRLWYIITWPSAIIAFVFGLWLFTLAPYLIEQPWMQAKLVLVVLLLIYHIKTHLIFNSLQNDRMIYTSYFMRIWNEGATLFLFGIVFLAILKNMANVLYALFALIILAVILLLSIRLYKIFRTR